MPRPDIRVDYIGREGRPVVIVDHFAPEPERLVAEVAHVALRAIGANYPGFRAPVPPSYFEGLGGMLATIARDVFDAKDRLSFDRALYSVSATPPEHLSLVQRIPHIDSVEGDRLAIVHFLGRKDFGGTAFFRHRTTGFETVTADRQRPYLDALKADFSRLGEPPPAYISGDTDIFERIALQPPSFNRALIYPSNLLHCAALPNDRSLPGSPGLGRLTVASFLVAR